MHKYCIGLRVYADFWAHGVIKITRHAESKGSGPIGVRGARENGEQRGTSGAVKPTFKWEAIAARLKPSPFKAATVSEAVGGSVVRIHGSLGSAVGSAEGKLG